MNLALYTFDRDLLRAPTIHLNHKDSVKKVFTPELKRKGFYKPKIVKELSPSLIKHVQSQVEANFEGKLKTRGPEALI